MSASDRSPLTSTVPSECWGDAASHYAGCACHESAWAAKLAAAEAEVARLTSRLDSLHRSKYEYARAENDRLRKALREIADICDCDRETPDGYGGDGHWRSCHTKADRGSCIARRALAPKVADHV